MEDRKLNEAESLDLIAAMIRNARTNQRARINCNIILVWGYVSVLVSLIVWVIKLYNAFSYSSLLWLLIPMICFPITKYMLSKDKMGVTSYIDRSIYYITILFVIICSTFGLSTFISDFPALFIEALLVCIWMVIMGILLKSKPIIWGGIIGAVVSYTLLFIPDMISQIPLFALTLVISIIIPGHLFKKSISQNV
ncbi:MAG: hypothetical protein VB074_00490 [Proteiniphilum sp.]|uniref:hypothetical protein n=1 Tax=Proteiniphilum sp. TaxID=1926877 RepID=UPI002B213064|nr:hypothetical protein [Proteiniphilum sp.]MEA5126640.1 hypothetical protein [Proteiniphilum sp.]